MGKTKAANGPSPAENQESCKCSKLPIYHSPLNDSYAPPSKKSKCTWSKDNKNQVNPHTTNEWQRTTKILPDVLHAIGNTPIVKLNKIPQSEGLKCNIYVKCEFMNPGGSVKDRIGSRMIEEAERQGILKPGSTIVEPSSGNTGIGLALAAAVKGYRCIIVMSEKMSNEKVAVLKALGAEAVRTPVTADSESPEGNFGVTYKLKHEIPNSVILDQYSNPGNPLAHYDTTAEEIYDQCDKNIDMIVIGAGTGGTLCGIGRKIKEISPNTTVVGVDPEGSILAVPECLNKTDITFYEVEGIGYDFVPTVLDRSVADVWVKTSDKESLLMARRLIKEEGLLCGTSSGAAMVGAIKAAKNLKPGSNVVVILPDSIRNYITKFITDQWMEARGFQTPVDSDNHWWWNLNVTKLDLKKPGGITFGMICMRAVQYMRKFGIEQAPVFGDDKDMVGVVTMQNILNGIISHQVKPTDSVEKVVSRVYPKLNKDANLGLVSRVLETESYVFIVETTGSGSSQVDNPIGLVTSSDFLEFITWKKPNSV